MRRFKQRIKKLLCCPYVIISLLVTLAYAPTFTGEFILDDSPLIKKNPYIKETHSLISYFVQEDGTVEREDGTKKHTGYYRPKYRRKNCCAEDYWSVDAHDASGPPHPCG